MDINTIVNSLVKHAPPGELKGVKQDLSALVPPRAIAGAIDLFIDANGAVFSGSYIASKFNKLPGSTKYIDFIGRQAFNVDVESGKIIDVEDYEPEVEYPEYFDDLVELLQQYGDDHYPSTYAYTIVPDGAKCYVIIIGQRLNHQNYYTGQWTGVYEVSGSSLNGLVKVDIHYYEDGNVRLNFEEAGQKSVSSGASIVNGISEMENEMTLKIVENFSELNQKYFKNLRRLLPVTRSKIHWGNAIGNYRLGSDAVN